MAWIVIKPANPGGTYSRQPVAPRGRLHPAGELIINAAAMEMLGWPARVLVEVEPNELKIRLRPTTPDNMGGFVLAGGGHSPHRARLSAMMRRYPQLVGGYAVARIAGGVELRQDSHIERIEVGDDDDGELIL